MSEINHRLGDRLRTLVDGEQPSAALRPNIEERLRRRHAPPTSAPRVLAFATVVATLIVGAALMGGGYGSSDSDQRMSAVMPAATGDPMPSGPDLPPGRSSTRVLIANATSTPGIADATLRRLEAAGYIGAGTLDAPALSATTRVFYAPGYEAEALDAARLLGLGVSAVNRTPPAVPEPNGAEVLVIVGTDLG
jgi:hypothetical protein